MTKRMLIDATHHEETRVVVMDGQRLTEFDYESQFRRQLKGNIFLAKVTRVEPSLQAAFVNFGGNRHGFLPFSEIHPDYYRIPVSDREAMMTEQRQLEEEAARREAEEDAAEEARLASQTEQATDTEGFIEPADDMPEADELERISNDDTDEDEVPRAQAHAAQELALDEAGYVHEDIELTVPDELDLHDEEDADHEDTDESGSGEGAAETSGTPNEGQEGGTSEGRNDNQRGNGRRGWRRGGRNGQSGGKGRYMGARRNRSSSDEITDDGPVGLHARFRRRYKIQEVIKRGQIMLVQVSKEERGNKGAAVTTYLSLPGRYCVLMPNSPRGGGVSRKIGNFADRRRLKSMLKALEIPSGMSVILRTAGVERSEAEIKRDYDYLLRLWDNIREMTLASNAPAVIYEEGDLIKRSIRDIYSRDIDELLISGEKGYNEARDLMSVLMPGHEENVKLYNDNKIPLFHRYQVESQITEIGEPIVQLKSGGYLVINQTEALVAVDVNSGRATKERHIEETALKTNLEAAEEVARQLRLRDLGGLVVIDFIDMEDRRNNAKVERRLKDALSSDRARIQVSRISTFGLLELSRQRLNPSLTEAQFQKCAHCHGFGFIRSVDSAAILALRALEDEGIRGRATRVTLHIPNSLALYILNDKREMLSTIEKRYGFNVMIHVDESLAPSGYLVEAMKAEVAESVDDDDQESDERPVRRKKPVAMEQALEAPDDAHADENDDATGNVLPADDDMSDENFNRPDIEPDGAGPNRPRRDRDGNREGGGRNRNNNKSRGPRRDRDSNREGGGRNQNNNGDTSVQPQGEKPESQNRGPRDDRPRRSKYGQRRGPNNRGPRDDQQNHGPKNEQGGQHQASESFGAPANTVTTTDRPTVSEGPKATYFVAKRRSNNEGQTTATAPVAPAPVEVQSSDPNAPKKKGWWSKFS